MDDNKILLTNDSLGGLKINAFGEKYFYNINRGSFDNIDSHTIFDSSFNKTLFNEGTLYIIIGSDSGLLGKYIKENDPVSGSRYIFIEPTNILNELESNNLLNEETPSIAYATPDNWQKTAHLFKLNEYLFIDNIELVKSIGAQDATYLDYAELSWSINEEINQLRYQVNTSLGFELFTIRQLQNLADNTLPAKLASNAFMGKTAVILAGGPSLDQVLPWIQKHRNNLIIFSVARISRQLIKSNIEPDFLFSVDPTDLSFDNSKEMLYFSNKPILIYSFHTVPSLVSQWHGIKLFLGNRFPWETQLNNENIGTTGPTVTNAAISTANLFGFKKIILGGVDLCFTKEGFTHATGSDEHIAGPRFNLTGIQVITNSGKMAYTDSAFEKAVRTVSLQAKLLARNEVKIINVSLNAAKIDYVEYIPLEEITIPKEDINFDIYSSITKLIQESPYNNSNATLKACLKELNISQYQIGEIKQLASTALEINNEMYNAQGQITNYKDKKKLNAIEQQFKRRFRKFSKVVKKFGIRSFLKITQPFNEYDNIDFKEAKNLANTYYEAFYNGSNKFLRLLEDAQRRIESRLEEEEKPNFEVLTKQWIKDKSFNRGTLWLKSHPDHLITSEEQKHFTLLEQEFYNSITHTATAHMARVKEQSSLKSFQQRATLLFNHNKINELKDFRDSLSQYKDQALVPPYKNLIDGYLFELNNDFESAKCAYNTIINISDSPLIEFSLQRIASIGFRTNDINNVLLALECLSHISPSYLPYYAEAIRLDNRFIDAVDIYNQYINLFPNDTSAQLKLASLYINYNIKDAASILIEYILSKTPDSKDALKLKLLLSQ